MKDKEKNCFFCNKNKKGDTNNTIHTKLEHIKLPRLVKEDLAKVHNEINQYINQRFLVTTTAITITSVILGWSTTKSSRLDPDHINMVFLSGCLSIIVLFIFYKTTEVINNNIIKAASYLYVTKSSKWEKIQQLLHEENLSKSYHGTIGFILIIFFSFGLLSFLIPFLIGMFSSPIFAKTQGLSEWYKYFIEFVSNFFCLKRSFMEYIISILYFLYFLYFLYKYYFHFENENNNRSEAIDLWRSLSDKMKNKMKETDDKSPTSTSAID